MDWQDLLLIFRRILLGAIDGLRHYFWFNLTRWCIWCLGEFFGGYFDSQPGCGAYQPEINAGKILMLVDIPLGREDEFQKLIKRHHLDASIKGMEIEKGLAKKVKEL